MTTQSVKLSDIRIDGGTQTRAAINDSIVEDYSIDMERGDKFPPVILFNDGAHKWLADGFHRYHASRKAEFLDVLADVRTGTRTDAVKYALGANRSNGLRRDNRDKRRCVEIALEEFSSLSDRAIAELCGVSNQFVSNLRPQLSTVDTSDQPATRTGADGKQYPVKKKAAEPVQEPETHLPVSNVEGRTAPIPDIALTPEQARNVAEAEQDSANLWNLKSYWKRASKRDRQAFQAWIAENQ